MKIMDRKGKIFEKVSIVDIGIVLLVVMAILGVRMYIAGQRGEVRVAAKPIPITLQVECTQLTETIAGSIMEGADIYNSVSGTYLGKITGVVIKEAEATSRDVESGRFIKTKVPERYDVTVIIDASGHVTDRNIAVSGEKILIGSSRAYLRSAGYVFSGFYTDISYDK